MKNPHTSAIQSNFIMVGNVVEDKAADGLSSARSLEISLKEGRKKVKRQRSRSLQWVVLTCSEKVDRTTTCRFATAVPRYRSGRVQSLPSGGNTLIEPASQRDPSLDHTPLYALTATPASSL
ncbi:MAG TPA: hypothetical protein VFS12_15725 [Terriglobia bacterium]|nr:hypothetical protein [Terriglobia bacterium]